MLDMENKYRKNQDLPKDQKNQFHFGQLDDTASQSKKQIINKNKTEKVQVIDDDVMTDEEQLINSQKKCLQELKSSILTFMGNKYNKNKVKYRFKKKIKPVSMQKKRDMVFNYMNTDILQGNILRIEFK